MRWKGILTVVLGTSAVVALGIYWRFSGDDVSLRLPGVVEIQEVRLGSKIGGRVEEVYVREGDVVKPDDVLVRLETPELLTQRAQQRARVQEAQAQRDKAFNGPRQSEIEQALAAVESAQARYTRAKNGFRTWEVDQAKSDLETAEADLKQAKEDYVRTEATYRRTASARAEYDAARAILDRRQGLYSSALAKYKMMEEGYRQEERDEAKAEWKKAQATYELLMDWTRKEEREEAEAKLAEAKARLEEIEANLKEAVVVAPENALIEVVSVRKGDVVPPNQPMIRALRTGDMWVKVYIPETQLGKLRLHQGVEVTVDSYPGRRFKGEVSQINSISEFTPRNIQSIDERHNQVFGVRVRVIDPQGVFKSGMAAEVIVPLHE
jgi:multidrug resistance efflux pump